MDTTSRIVGNIKQPQLEQPQLEQPSKTEKKSAKKPSGVEKNFPIDFGLRRWLALSYSLLYQVRPVFHNLAPLKNCGMKISAVMQFARFASTKKLGKHDCSNRPKGSVDFDKPRLVFF